MTAGERVALVVAVDRYDNPSLQKLAAPAADAAALEEVLGDPDLGGFEVEVLLNSSSSVVRRRVEVFLAGRMAPDLAVIHFSCHGLKNDHGELYLAATDTAPELLASTGIEAGWLNRVMQRSRAQSVVLFLDCCYGGAFARGVVARAGGGIDVGDQFVPVGLSEGRGRAVITASTAMEYAFEGTQLADGRGRADPSVFTGALVEGIRTGEADRNGDGAISLSELYDYVYDRVRERSPQQTPGKWEFGIHGGLLIARNPHRRITPGRLPPDLLDLVEHSSPLVRLTAVGEFAELAAGTNLAVAAAARLHLARLADDDSRRVSAAATQALDGVTVRLTRSAIDLGRVRCHTAPLVTDVAVEGGPLALASAVSVSTASGAASADSLRARLDAGILRITWTPAQTGSLDAVVALTGPAGEATLRVIGEVVADFAPAARSSGLLDPATSTDGATVTATGDRQPLAAQSPDPGGTPTAPVDDPAQSKPHGLSRRLATGAVTGLSKHAGFGRLRLPVPRPVLAAAAILVLGMLMLSLLLLANSPQQPRHPETPSPGGGTTGPAAFNSALTSVVNPSTKTGGTLKYVHPYDWDSPDPGNTYYAFSWNFSRYYARPLMTFKPVPGNDGLTLVPDLATGPGQVSADGLTWTYKIRSGVKFEDGTPVTSKDVKYAVERSNYAPEVLSLGPVYFHQYLTDDQWSGPYKDPSNDKLNFKGIETPDDTTIVFHLKQKFAEFDYLVSNPQTAPVPRAKDTGAKYLLHPVSTGPYMFEKYDVGKSLTLVKNPNWSQENDPVRHQYVDRIEVAIKVAADDRDNRLISGQADLDAAGTGVEPSAQARVLKDENLKKNADNPQTGFLRFIGINVNVKPFDNVHCRMAVLYAADHQALQSAYGGPTSGDIATTAIPPTDTGYVKADTYNFLQDKNGNVDKAKAELQQCGQPNGFTANIIARGNRPKEVAGATALQQALTKVGIKTDIQTFPSGQYTGNYAGSPQYLHSHNVGLIFYGWGADWPSGFGFLQQISDSRAIKDAGNSNVYELRDKVVDDLLDQAAQNPDKTTREGYYTQIDQEIMKQAVMLPIIYEKTLMYRNPGVSNVFVNPAFGMYDYVAVGLNR